MLRESWRQSAGLSLSNSGRSHVLHGLARSPLQVLVGTAAAPNPTIHPPKYSTASPTWVHHRAQLRRRLSPPSEFPPFLAVSVRLCDRFIFPPVLYTSLSGVALLAVWLAAKHTCSYVAGDVPQRSFERGRACERAWGCREFSFYIRAVGYQLLLLCAPRQDALASKYRAGIYLLSKISRPRQGCVKSGACPGPHRSSKSMMTTVPAPFFPLSALSLDATAPAMRLPSRSQHTS